MCKHTIFISAREIPGATTETRAAATILDAKRAIDSLDEGIARELKLRALYCGARLRLGGIERSSVRRFTELIDRPAGFYYTFGRLHLPAW